MLDVLGTRDRRSLAAVLAIALAASAASAAPPGAALDAPAADADRLRQAICDSMIADAALADVYFVDRATGWAVGDRGAIWHTGDGGRTWQRQASKVSCRLNSITFVDRATGWAVGGAIQPATHASRGVVLRTTDGGRSWHEVPKLLLPLLTRVRFFDHQRGVALGAGLSLAPGGVFRTSDGGQTWQALPADGRGHWLAGDFLDPSAGAVAGAGGQLATVVERRVTLSPLAGATTRSLRAIRLTAPTGGWLVGDGGVVRTTHDLGRSWQSPPSELPEFVTDNFDFYAVAVEGTHVWIAGAPGSRVFHSADAGRTWQMQATGQTAPLRALWFIDERTGWAAGELGTILATQDGGRTWQVQRAGGKRAAMAAMFGRAADVPLEAIAQYGAAEGYLVSVDLLHLPTAEGGGAGGDFLAVERSRAAMIEAGATAAHTSAQFPLAPTDLALSSDQQLAALNRLHDGRAGERMSAHLVRELRTWRPEIVVTYHPDFAATDASAAISQEAIFRSIEAAADPTQFVDLATGAGLEAWRVKRVYGLLPSGSRGQRRLNTNEFSQRLGRTPADWAASARHLMYSVSTSPPDAFELVLMTEDDDTSAGRDLFAGIALSPGGEARRELVPLPESNVDALRRMAEKRRNMQQLLERSAGSAVWASQVTEMVDGLDATSGGQLLFQLAEGYRTAGRLDLAADTYYLLARRWPQHPLADRSLTWLVQFYASGEAGMSCQPSAVSRQAEEELDLADSRQTTADSSVRQASAVAPLGPAAAPTVGLSRDDRLRRAAQLGKYLEESRPALFAEPSVRFPLVAAQRQLGFANPAQRYFLALGGLPEGDPWRRCAETELWFTEPGDRPPPKAMGVCRRTSVRPHLDGKLDEPLWKAADELRLTGEEIPEVRLAYDDAYLYVAIRCPKQAGVDYAADERPRERDADLSARDRMELRIDTDRDFGSAFELEIDDRGWARDACWGDAGWNPQWFIAASGDEESWTAEAAIPLAALAAVPPTARHVWAVSARRTIPGVGHQSWAEAQPAAGEMPAGTSANSPERFGLVIFD